MPELPEVETVVRDLRPLLAGRTITSARHSKHKLRRPWLAKWNANATGARIEGVRRRGKWILVDIASPQPLAASRAKPPAKPQAADSPRSVLRIHLGMSGQFTVVPASEPEAGHVHVVFALDNGTELRLRDPRRFGGAEFFPDRIALEAEMNTDLGPEPFGLDADYFRAAVRGTSRNLKALLLDQKLVAGVGNIYADEACFRARLHPGRAGKSLTGAECDALREAIKAVLLEAIKKRGTSFDEAYIGGGYQPAVYGRTGQPCPTCKTSIACARYAGRASHYCPQCQKDSPQSRPRKTKTAPVRKG